MSSRAGILLLALLLFRAYVPVGFMPANGVPFALQLCPAFTAVMPAHAHHHGGAHSDFESCPFGSAPAAAPLSHPIDFAGTPPAPLERTAALETLSPLQRIHRTHPPRGPPVLV